MKNIPKKFIWIGLGLIVIVFFIIYFSSGSKEVPNSNTSASGLSAQNGSNPASSSMGATEISKNTAFISTLLSLNKIRIDTAIFNSDNFSSLSDNYVEILNDGIVGRKNPFAPFYQEVQTSTESNISNTNQKINIPVVNPNKKIN